MKRIFFLALSYFATTTLEGQQTSLKNEPKIEDQQQYLGVGDKLPDVILSTFDNYPGKLINTKSFKGKYLLIDFWDLNCTSCIVSMPKLQMIQNEIGDSLQILLVTRNAKEQVDAAKKKIKTLRDCKLTSVYGDNKLSRLFYYTSVPHQVWIDREGIIRYIAPGYYTSLESMRAFMNGTDLKLPLKDDKNDVDISQPLWLEGGGRNAKYIQYYSYITGFVPNTGSTQLVYDSVTGRLTGIKMWNADLKQHYLFAFGEFGNKYGLLPGDANRVVLEVRDTSVFIVPKMGFEADAWAKDNVFSYEIKVPADKSHLVYEYMRQDLQRFFPYSGTIEKRPVKCLALVNTRDIKAIATTGGKRKFESISDTVHLIRNYSIIEFINVIRKSYRRMFPRLPFLNEVQYTGKVDMDINCSLTDVPAMRRELSKYGLDLIETVREIEVLVIRDQPLHK